MTKRTFTDDSTGNKYELEPVYPSGARAADLFPGKPLYDIKPIPKAVEKKECRVRLDIYGDYDAVGESLFNKLLIVTPPQAQAVAAAIKALMEYVQDPIAENGVTLVAQAASKARKALQEDV